MTGDVLFDESARNFAAGIDASIAENQYKRGELFVHAVKQHVRAGGEVLDYGCGPGRLARLVAKAGYRVHGLDPSTGMLEEARRQDFGDAEARFERLTDGGESLATDRYDGVMCSSTIEYVPGANALLGHFRRCLRSDGVLVLSFSNRPSLWRRASKVLTPSAPHLRLQHNIWSFEQCEAALQRAGFTVNGKPIYFDAAPFDKRPLLRSLSSLPIIGTLGLVVARRA